MSVPYSYGSTAEAVNNYYTGTDGWTTISNAANMTESNAADVLSNTSNVTKMLNADGSVRTYTIDSASSSLTAEEQAALDAAHAVDSNSGAGTAAATDAVSLAVPANAVSTTGKLSLSSSIGLTADTGVTVTGVLGTIGAAVAAVSAGIAMGQLIDSALYNANPDFWDSKGMSTLNPDTWSAITAGDTSAGAKIINALFHFDQTTKKSTMYIDQNALAYFTGYIGSKNAYKYNCTNKTQYANSTGTIDTVTPSMPVSVFTSETTIYSGYYPYGSDIIKTVVTVTPGNSVVYGTIFINTNATQNGCNYYVLESSSPFHVTNQHYKNDVLHDTYEYTTSTSAKGTHDSKTIYSSKDTTALVGYDLGHYAKDVVNITLLNITAYYGKFEYSTAAKVVSGYFTPNFQVNVGGWVDNINAFQWMVVHGGTTKKNLVDGISPAPNATPFNADGINDWSDINGILQAQHSQYPNLFNNAVTQNVPQPDGTLKPYTYVPCPMPQTNPDIDDPIADPQPVTSPATSQADPSVDPDDPPSVTDPVSGSVGKTPTPNPPPSGVGTTPAVITPTGSASALYTVYNPTQAQLNSFGAWLWSSSFADQILKLFSNPMQAIIGLHKIYCDPSVSGTSNIKVGYLDSGVSANVVSNQYTTVDCGTINLLEKFGNVFDYAPYTSVGIYLPFIGIVQLNVADVMRSSLNVVYHFDVLTGAIYVEVKVIRDSGNGGTIYTYSGNGASQYPLSSGSYMGIVSGIMSIAGGIAGTIASGGAAMPLLMGAASSAMNMHTNVERSGSITGNAGAMGAKIPYLIITRPQTAMADNYSKYNGVPANQEMRIGNASGFCKFLTLHLTNITATDAEKAEIQNLFESGVLI